MKKTKTTITLDDNFAVEVEFKPPDASFGHYVILKFIDPIRGRDGGLALYKITPDQLQELIDSLVEAKVSVEELTHD